MNTTKTRLTLLALYILSCHTLASVETDSSKTLETLEMEAKLRTKVFAEQLKQTLGSAITVGGLSLGIKVCSEVATDIAEQHSTDGWTVMRKSLKRRNPENTPTTWQAQVLKDFETQQQTTLAVKDTIVSEFVNTNQGREYRFAKAIPTKKVCLNCHGVKLKDKVKKVIANKYRDDLAIDYQLDQIRGAFFLTKRL